MMRFLGDPNIKKHEPPKPTRMNASEIIAELKRLIEIHGDVPVKAMDEFRTLSRLVRDVRYSSGNSLQKPHIKIVANS